MSPTSLMLFGIIARQLLIMVLRRTGKSHFVHAHDLISTLPLGITALTCVLALIDGAPSMQISIFSRFHISCNLAPQLFAWLWCLRNRNEFTPRQDFAAHVVGVSVCIVLLLVDSIAAPRFALLLSVVSLLLLLCSRRSNSKCTRLALIWSVLCILCFQRIIVTARSVQGDWLTAACELALMFAIKFKFAIEQHNSNAVHSMSKTSLEGANHSTVDDVEQIIFASEIQDLFDPDFPCSASPPTRSLGSSPQPPDLIRTDSQCSNPPNATAQVGMFPTFHHHRRDVSVQSNASWGWGPAVMLDFASPSSNGGAGGGGNSANNSSPRSQGSSSSEEELFMV